MYAHQDWNTVVFHKKTSEAQKQAQNKIVSQHQPSYKAKLDDNPEDFSHKMFDKPYIQQIISNRINLKWNQKQLAQVINEDVGRIQRLEQGKEVYDHKLKSKLNRALGITSK